MRLKWEHVIERFSNSHISTFCLKSNFKCFQHLFELIHKINLKLLFLFLIKINDCSIIAPHL